jgi:hypothetical protein
MCKLKKFFYMISKQYLRLYLYFLGNDVMKRSQNNF